MNTSSDDKYAIRWMSVKILERFKNVLYPINIPVLLRRLPEIGYVVPRKVHKGILEPGEGIAVKGNVELVFNQDNKVLGVEGRNIIETIDGFNELREFWFKQLALSPIAETHYVELSCEGFQEAKKNPVEVLTKFWTQFKAIETLSNICGISTTNYGLRLVPQNTTPNNVDWLDVRIEPPVISNSDQYYVNVVWRDEKLGETLTKFRKIEEIITRVIKEIEK